MNNNKYSWWRHLPLGATLALALLAGCSEEEPGSELNAPVLLADGATDVARTTVTVQGSIDGNLENVTSYGVVYSISQDFPSDGTTVRTLEGKPEEGFCSLTLQNLTPNTHYYYCWFASTGASEVRSRASEFTTTSTSKPLFSALTTDTIGENFVRFRCRVEEIGDTYLVEYGVSYKTKTETVKTFIPIAADSLTDRTTNEYVVEIKNLNPATSYEVKPYAKNSSDKDGASGMLEGYGETIEVQTANQQSPELELLEPSDVGYVSAKATGKVVRALGSNGKIEERGFCYGETEEPTIANAHVKAEGTTLNELYSATLTDLKENTTYYVRAYAKNIVDGKERYGYSKEVFSFTTTQLEKPWFNYSWGSDGIDATSIEITATIENFKDANVIAEKGFIWDEVNGEVTLETVKEGHKLVITEGNKTFTGKITGLKMNTRYFVRAYATYKAGENVKTGYSGGAEITTNSFQAASLSYPQITEVSHFSATLTGGISDSGNGTIVKRGFCISQKNQEPTIESNDLMEVTDENFTWKVEKLQPNTSYYVRAFAVCQLEDKEETVYSGWNSFNTLAIQGASFNLIESTDVELFTATVSIGISAVGDGELIEKGFCWIENDGQWINPDLENNTGMQAVADGTPENFKLNITNLKHDKEYIICAYAKTKLGDIVTVSYSGSTSIHTRSIQGASFNDINITSTGFATLTVASGINNAGDGELIEKGFCWLKIKDGIWINPKLENCTGSTAVTDGTMEEFVLTINQLLPNTQYTVCAYAKTKLGEAVTVSYSGTTSSSTNGLSVSANVSNIAGTTCEVSGYFFNEMPELEEYGFCWTTDENAQPSLDNKVASTNLDENRNFSATLEGLATGTTYYVRAYVTCEGVTVYEDGYRTFTTKRIPGKDDNVSPDKKD